MAEESLSNRILRSSSSNSYVSRASPTPEPTMCRPSVYKKWTDLSMLKALDAVNKREMTVREAAVCFDVPRSTLGDRASGRVQHGNVSGPQKYLTTAEENELARFLIRCASIGYPKTRLEVISLVQAIVDNKGIRKTLSSGWWQMFCRRNPSVTLRAPAPISKARAYASDPDLIERYFDLLEETLECHNLKGKPSNIFNMDETGMPLDPKSLKQFEFSSETGRTHLKYQPMLSPAPKVRKEGSQFDGSSDDEGMQSNPATGDTPGRYDSAEPGLSGAARMQISSEDSDSDSPRRLQREDTPDSESVQPFIYCSQAKKFLKTPVPPPKKLDPSKVKSCGKVLTSKENMERLDQEAKVKAEKIRLKAEKARIAAEKRAARAAKKASCIAKSNRSASQHLPTSKSPSTPVPTAKELELFNTRFENGYDLTTDDRYTLWLKHKKQPHISNAVSKRTSKPSLKKRESFAQGWCSDGFPDIRFDEDATFGGCSDLFSSLLTSDDDFNADYSNKKHVSEKGRGNGEGTCSATKAAVKARAHSAKPLKSAVHDQDSAGQSGEECASKKRGSGGRTCTRTVKAAVKAGAHSAKPLKSGLKISAVHDQDSDAGQSATSEECASKKRGSGGRTCTHTTKAAVKAGAHSAKPHKSGLKSAVYDQDSDAGQSGMEDDSECAAVCIIHQSGIEFPRWIACDVCANWYHLYCVGLKKDVDYFICCKCTGS